MDRQLPGALASRREDEEECLVYPWASLLKPHLPYSINLLSHFVSKTTGFMMSQTYTISQRQGNVALMQQ